MGFDRERYLQPSQLCDFDRSPAIKKKTGQLIRGCRNRREKFQRILSFVKELPYGLEDWDLKASLVLKKGWGMCSGKTNLLVAMLRYAGIPARYRIYKIDADRLIWQQVSGETVDIMKQNELGQLHDHVDCEVWLGKWMDCDPGRDTPMEKGILKLGGALERHKVTGKDGRIKYLKLAAFDRWASERQGRRKFRSDRKDVFSVLNQGFEKLRELGRY